MNPNKGEHWRDIDSRYKIVEFSIAFSKTLDTFDHSWLIVNSELFKANVLNIRKPINS